MTHDYGGIMGILGAAGVVFFAYIGFDAVSTAAQEAKNPGRDMPIGILGSLVVCTILYVLFSYVLSGVATVEDFRSTGREASVAFAISKYMIGYEWLSKSVTVAILFGFSSVILVMLLGQSRVFYSMSHDGLVPPIFAEVHPKYRTPYKSNMVFFVFTALFAAFMPGDIVGEMTSIGTLFAFILVCVGVWIMRQPAAGPSARLHGAGAAGRRVARHRRLRRDDLRAGLDELGCGCIVWLVIGMVFYFGYGRSHSRLAGRLRRAGGAPGSRGGGWAGAWWRCSSSPSRRRHDGLRRSSKAGAPGTPST